MIADEDFVEPEINRRSMQIQQILVSQSEFFKMIKELNARKAMESYGITGWILRKCSVIGKLDIYYH